MKHEIDMTDDEYMTPAQRAELRRTMTELPLWVEMELAKDATIAIDPNAIDCFSTVAPKVDADTNEMPDAVPSANAARPTWADYVAQIELHRQLNKTEGMESEE